MDEGDGYGYRDADAYQLRRFRFSAGTLTSSATHAGQGWQPTNTLERVEVLGATEPSRITLTHKGATRELSFYMADATNRQPEPEPRTLARNPSPSPSPNPTMVDNNRQP